MNEEQQVDPFDLVDLQSYDLIFANTSGGKDSALALKRLVDHLDAEGISRERLVAVHAIMDEEWEGTVDLVTSHAHHYGIRLETVQRVQSLLAQVLERGMWPSPKQRYCTSDHKRDQIAKIMTKLVNELRSQGRRSQVRILNAMGMRAEESSNRKKMPKLEVNKRHSNGRRHVDNFLPIHNVTNEEAFASLDVLPTTPHPCYSCGIGRASCRFCIYAPPEQIHKTAVMPENRELWEEYLRVEEVTGHTFKADLSLRSIEDKIQAGEEVPDTVDDGQWGM